MNKEHWVEVGAERPGPESWLLYMLNVFSALWFWCTSDFLHPLDSIKNPSIFWPILSWAVQAIYLVALLLPLVWAAMIWYSKPRARRFFWVTLVVLLATWGANIGFGILYYLACPTCGLP